MACNDIISDATIEIIYNDSNLVTSNVVETECIDRNTKNAKINIFNHDDNMLHLPIERNYYRESPLYSSDEVGKVVKHKFFILKDTYKNKRIASKIHPKELDAYRQNNFKEIQLSATSDGLVVWKKMFFEFQNKIEENKIKILIQKYLKEVKGMSKSQIVKAIGKNPFSINPKLLFDKDNENNSFSEWILTHSNVIVVNMYKEIL